MERYDVAKPIPYYREVEIEEKRKSESALASRIWEAIDTNSFIGCVVFGAQRIGKSAYALKILHEIYGDWNVVLNNYVLYDIRDVIDLLKTSVREKREIKAFAWDDAGCHCGKYLHFTDRKRAQLLQNLFDVIGLYLGGAILTTPNPTNLLKAVRDYEFYRVKVTRKNKYWGRHALGYRNIILPSGSSFIKKVFQDSFSCRVPNEVYHRYEDMRKHYTEIAIERLERYVSGGEVE